MSQVSLVTSDTFQSDVLASTKPVLVDFYADWCGPCKMVLPVLDELSQMPEFSNVNIVKVNVDNSADIAQKYNVRGIPTLMLVQNGQVVATKSGTQTKEQLKAFINSNIKDDE